MLVLPGLNLRAKGVRLYRIGSTGKLPHLAHPRTLLMTEATTRLADTKMRLTPRITRSLTHPESMAKGNKAKPILRRVGLMYDGENPTPAGTTNPATQAMDTSLGSDAHTPK